VSRIIQHTRPSGAILLGPGKRLVFTTFSSDALALEEEVTPDAPPVPLHLNRRQARRFTVLDGTLDLTIAGERKRLGPGETALVKPDIPHTYANGDPSTTRRIAVLLSPALEAHLFFESVYGLGQDGALPPKTALSHRHAFDLAALPMAVQRPLMAVGAGLAALAGVRP
jgi:mannose-6-phosphate isomerase-like protein (cupin superfamily)